MEAIMHKLIIDFYELVLFFFCSLKFITVKRNEDLQQVFFDEPNETEQVCLKILNIRPFDSFIMEVFNCGVGS